MSAIVIIGAEGELGQRLADRYREAGNAVTAVALAPQDLTMLANELAARPIDLIIFADAYRPAPTAPEGVTREALRDGLDRLAFAPFRLAALLQPALTATKARAVLLSRREGIVSLPDEAGRYLDRPFRAAAHALWRCLAVEWAPSGIDCALVTVADQADISALVETIASATSGMLVDSERRELAW